MPAVQYEEIASKTPGESSANIRGRIEAARAIQYERFGKAKTSSNARMNSKLIRTHCVLDQDCQALLKMAMEELGLSARACDCPFI